MASIGLSDEDWQARYIQQVRWTKDLRDYVFQRLHPGRLRRVLEVGCGPGALTAEIGRRTGAQMYGLDLHAGFFPLARKIDPSSTWVAGNGLALPFRRGGFDLVYCHFFLLWAGEPARALSEMARVTVPGGLVIALAEPDYAGRIDYPPQLTALGLLQAEALSGQGADPNLGRSLGELFSQAGLTGVEYGLLGGQWSGQHSDKDLESEWEILEADLRGRLPPDRLRELKRADETAWQRGGRVLFVPTFYAWGRVPK